MAGVEHLFRLTAAHTGGRFAFEEFTLAPGVIGARPKSIMATTSTSTSSTAN